MTPREWHEHIARRLNVSIGFEDFRATWGRVLAPETILSEALFAQLSARCRLALLSNTDPLHVESLERDFAFMRYFPARIYSCKVGACKPSPAIYQAALDALGVKPAHAVYVDDIEEFADAARTLGMDAIRFIDSAQLTRELTARGLLP